MPTNAESKASFETWLHELKYAKPNEPLVNPHLIRFGCSIRLPQEGNFMGREQFQKDPQQFLLHWITGAVGNIYTGPLLNVRDAHDGHLLVVPRVTVRYLKNL